MSSIAAGTTTTTGYVVTSDSTGALVLKTGASATTAVTIGADQSVTFAGSQTFSGGTANGVLYLNGSKAVTSGSSLVYGGSNLILTSGGTWATDAGGLQFSMNGNDGYITTYYDQHSVTVGAGVSFKNRIKVSAHSASNNITFFVNNSQAMTLDASGNLTLSNGSLTAGNTGVVLVGRYSSSFPSPGAGYFSLETNNSDGNNGGISIKTLASGTLSERARIDQNGNMGIGTSSPGQRLDVNGNIRTRDGGLSLTVGTGQQGVFCTYNRITGSGSDYTPTIFAETGLGITFAVNGSVTKVMTLDSGGNLMIGTSTTAGKLSVGGKIRALSGDIELDSGQVTTNSTANPLRLGVDGVERARIGSNGGMSIGTTTTAPASGLRVQGGVNPIRGIVNDQLIAGYVATNYSGTRYWVLHNMTGNPFTAFNCMGSVHASSYTTWNLSNLWIRRAYNSFSVFGAITGIIQSGVTVSIVDITYSSSRYVAIKFAGGDPGIEANLIGYGLDSMYTNGTDAFFINGTGGVTENAVIATY